MIDRRTALVGSVTALGLFASGGAGRVSAAADPVTLRIAALRFGSLSWLLETLRAEGLDAKGGFQVATVDIATNQAGPVALLSGDVDLMVSDWPWALRQRAQGVPLQFAPFTSALGAVMVPLGSDIKALKDLVGKRLGVAGSPIDKSWLLLRAYGTKVLGKDLATVATPVFGAAPLLAEEIKNGRLDAVLEFWPFAARLVGAGFTPMLTMGQVMSELGLSPVPALVGFIWKEGGEPQRAAAIDAFLSAAAGANAVLATSDAAWERVKPLLKAQSEPEFTELKRFYRAGIPAPWGAGETKSAEALMAILAAAGDADLAGHDTKFDAKLFHVAAH